MNFDVTLGDLDSAFCCRCGSSCPFGAYPGTVQGRYSSDPAHVVECFGAMMQGNLQPYLEKWVYSVASHEETIEKRIGWKKLQELQRRETIREGYTI